MLTATNAGASKRGCWAPRHTQWRVKVRIKKEGIKVPKIYIYFCFIREINGCPNEIKPIFGEVLAAHYEGAMDQAHLDIKAEYPSWEIIPGTQHIYEHTEQMISMVQIVLEEREKNN